MPKTVKVKINRESDLLVARHAAREASSGMGFNIVDQTRFVTAVSEITRNTFMYAGKGQMILSAITDSDRKGLMVRITDRGPGIVDLDLAMKDGYSSRGGIGNGLGGSKRLVDEFRIESRAGQGTKVELIKWKE